MGCDPEFFFSTKRGRIIGSEKIIPKGGIKTLNSSKVIIDGVQAELNPEADTCRQRLANNITMCFNKVKAELAKNKTYKADFRQTIKVTKKELDSLAPESRVFGCMPSKNIHTPNSKIAVRDASKYPYRSGGGHIHIGIRENSNGSTSNSYLKMNEAIKNPKRLVPMLDIIVGNTCVLIDRDPGNIERRQVYGKAGEFRTPKHGLEYRTLSNFWLQNYQLMSLVIGLARTAVLIISNSNKKCNFERKIRSRVNMHQITKAINNNDFDLALKNFKRIKKVLKEIVPMQSETDRSNWPLNEKNIKDFEFFISKGKENWMKQDPLKHWTTLGNDNNKKIGWEDFLEKTIRPERELALKAK
jgi:hypothetical protein